jgi:tRNA dimethylallyltransferase
MKSKVPKLIVIVGETASGKSALAMEVARQFNGEIICADSWTVRREVNIGTAKPSQQDQAEVPHHLIDVVGPDEDFTAAVFKKLAGEAIEDIANRGKLPIMVGGTGLYVDGVLYDYGFLPAGDRGDREELNQLNVEELLNKIAAMGLELGAVDTRNKRRLIRLIETKGQVPVKREYRSNTLILGIKSDREELKQRIEKRVDGMIADGLEAEVSGLVKQYGWDCEALKGVGYAQWRGHQQSQESIDEVRQKIIKASLDLAKRQRTWFKRNNCIQWFSTPVNHTLIVETVTTFLQR